MIVFRRWDFINVGEFLTNITHNVCLILTRKGSAVQPEHLLESRALRSARVQLHNRLEKHFAHVLEAWQTPAPSHIGYGP